MLVATTLWWNIMFCESFRWVYIEKYISSVGITVQCCGLFRKWLISIVWDNGIVSNRLQAIIYMLILMIMIIFIIYNDNPDCWKWQSVQLLACVSQSQDVLTHRGQVTYIGINMRQWTRSLLVQLPALRLHGAKPWHEPILKYNVNLAQQTPMKFSTNDFFYKEIRLGCHLQTSVISAKTNVSQRVTRSPSR